MKRQLFLLIILIVFVVFGYVKQEENNTSIVQFETTKIAKIIDVANSYVGVSYRAGGTTPNGMDCSGLINTSFKQIGINLPRSSSTMSTKGTKVNLENVQPGDLLFFDISRLEGEVNHVGLVTSVDNGDIRFIHSTTSQGVIVNSLHENYWKQAFIKAKRVI